MGKQIGAVIFTCGKAGGVHIVDEHDIAAEKHLAEMNRIYVKQHGEPPDMDQQVDWLIEGREASERRLSIKDSRRIDAAIGLLEKHGYTVSVPTLI